MPIEHDVLFFERKYFEELQERELFRQWMLRQFILEKFESEELYKFELMKMRRRRELEEKSFKRLLKDSESNAALVFKQFELTQRNKGDEPSSALHTLQLLSILKNKKLNEINKYRRE